MSCASLWADIPCVLGPRWVEEALRRAGSSKLTMRHSMYRTVSLLSPDTFSDLLYRTVDLRLMRRAKEIDKIVRELTTPARALETLVISLNIYEPDPFHCFPLVLPTHFLAGRTPRLRNLVLDRAHVPWDSPLLCNLTSLTLRYHKYLRTEDAATLDEGWGMHPNDFIPSCDQFLDVLRACPSLRELSLRWCLPSLPTDYTLEDTTPVPLDRLENLDLQGDFAGVEFVLQHCVFPQAAFRIAIQVDLQEDEVPRLIPALCILLPAVRAHRLRSCLFAVDQEAGPVSQIKAWQKVVAKAPWGEFDCEPPEDILIGVRLTDDSSSACMANICNLFLVPEDIETVGSACSSMIPMSFLTRTNLKHLYVNGQFPRCIFDVGTEPSFPGTCAPGPLRFPKLETIWLHTKLSDDGSVWFPVSEAEHLGLWLSMRSGAGMRQIDSLVIDCDSSSPSEASLRNFKSSVLTVATKTRWNRPPEPFEG
ncbi:hypothetical protein BC834DRAFT_970432 [Gloeopeniophorella convolvens]|nr:hypothetical protein BC834DRAFT_970432 [Gloeopeniophorella convolvens]